MKSDRRSFILAIGALCASPLLPAQAAAAELELQQPGTLRVAVYADFAPYSARGKGVDVAIAQALAEKLGLRVDIVEFPAGEDMSDDLRNMVWRGHYLGTRPADVMMHVPVDRHFAQKNDKVTIFAPYHLETIALARHPERVSKLSGMPSEAFEIFTQEKVGAELDTHASDFLLQVANGRIRDNVVHFRSVAEAVAAMTRGEVAAVMGPHAQLEGALGGNTAFALDILNLPGMRATSWPLGMAVKADRNALQAALENALQDLQRSGALQQIFAQHGLTHRLP